ERPRASDLSQLLSTNGPLAIQRHQTCRGRMSAHLTWGIPAPLRAKHFKPRDVAFARAFLDGMKRVPKSVPCKFFYDDNGSALFDRICGLAEYYPTRTEMALLLEHAVSIAERMGAGVELIEFGAGSLTKVRLLLDVLREPVAYIPIDISGDYLSRVCA